MRLSRLINGANVKRRGLLAFDVEDEIKCGSLWECHKVHIQGSSIYDERKCVLIIGEEELGGSKIE